MGSSTLQQQTIHLVFGTDEGMVREKASGIFAVLTEGTNEFSHEILEAACGDSDEAAQVIRQVMEALRTLPFFPGRKVVWMKNCNFLGDSVTGRSSTTEAALDCWKAAWGRTSCCLFPPPNLTNAVPLTNSCFNTPHRKN